MTEAPEEPQPVNPEQDPETEPQPGVDPAPDEPVGPSGLPDTSPEPLPGS
jgi:hypothetical protein